MPAIVITGLGIVSALGQGVADFQAALFAGQSGMAMLSFPYRGKEVLFPGAPVKDGPVNPSAMLMWLAPALGMKRGTVKGWMRPLVSGSKSRP